MGIVIACPATSLDECEIEWNESASALKALSKINVERVDISIFSNGETYKHKWSKETIAPKSDD